MSQQNIYNDLFNMIKVSVFRRELAKRDHRLFFCFYFNHYLTHNLAPFHHDFFDLTNNLPKILVLPAFRGSGKSTIFSTSYPMWAIMGKPKKKFILIGSKTMGQAAEIIKNIKTEIESNNLLRKDMGPFSERNEWNSYSLVFEKYKAKITAISVGDSIRGLRFMESRPDAIILDDLDDLASVQNFEQRESLANWFTGEILPIGSDKTNIIVIGNLLHDDSLISRWKKKAEENTVEGLVYKEYPLLDTNNKPLWPSRYPDQNSIDQLKVKMGHASFSREYMLKIIPDDEQIIQPDWIKTYHELPPLNYINDFEFGVAAVDFATGAGNSSKHDYTAIVSAYVFDNGQERTFYILPNLINTKEPLDNVLKSITGLSKTLVPNAESQIIVEENGFQKAISQMLRKLNVSVIGVTHSTSKWQRLNVISPLLQNGRVLFPEKGCEALIEQLLNFGSTQHDDLADAFMMVLEEASKINRVGLRIGDQNRIYTIQEIEEQKRKAGYRRMVELEKMNRRGDFL